MADEAPVTEITQESVAKTEAANNSAQASEQTENYDGTEYVDFEKLDPKVRARFNRLYGHVKQNERITGEMAKMLRAATDRLAELEANVTKDKKADVLLDLKAQKVAALDAGDSRRVVELDEKISEVQAMRITPRKVETPQIDTSNIPDEDGDAFEMWSAEKNADGSIKRPWANPKHEDHAEAAQIGASVFSSKKFKDAPIEEKLAEIDRRMNLANGTAERSSSAVLASNSGARPAPGKRPGLSADEKRIAERMYESMPATKAHERYLASKQAVYGARA